jgi:hypothetical protein
MDRLERYSEIVRRVIEEYARHKPSHGEIETEAIADPEADHYEVVHVGWDGPRRVHGSVVHIDIKAGKVWVQYDGTSRPVAEELAAAGIPREDIVLGFHPADVRGLTGFAAGLSAGAGACTGTAQATPPRYRRAGGLLADPLVDVSPAAVPADLTKAGHTSKNDV